MCDFLHEAGKCAFTAQNRQDLSPSSVKGYALEGVGVKGEEW